MMYKMKEKQLSQQVDQLKKELAMCKKKLAKEIRNFEKQEVRRLLTADKSVLDSENEDIIVEGKGQLENRCSVSESEKKDLKERLEQSESDNARMKRELDDLAAKFNAMQRNMEIAKPLSSGIQGEAVKNIEAYESEFVDKIGLVLDKTISNRSQGEIGAGDDQYKKGSKNRSYLDRREQEVLSRGGFIHHVDDFSNKSDDEISLGEFSPRSRDEASTKKGKWRLITKTKRMRETGYDSCEGDDISFKGQGLVLGAVTYSESKTNLVKIKKGTFRRKERYKKVHYTMEKKKGLMSFIRDWKMKRRLKKTREPEVSVSRDTVEGPGTDNDVVPVRSDYSETNLCRKQGTLWDGLQGSLEQLGIQDNALSEDSSGTKDHRIVAQRQAERPAKPESSKKEKGMNGRVKREDLKRKGLLSSLRGCFGGRKGKVSDCNSETYGAENTLYKDDTKSNTGTASMESKTEVRRILFSDQNEPKNVQAWVYSADSDESGSYTGHRMLNRDSLVVDVHPMQGVDDNGKDTRAEKEMQLKRTILQLREENARLKTYASRNQQQNSCEVWSSNQMSTDFHELQIVKRQLGDVRKDLREAARIAEEANGEARRAKENESKATAVMEEYRRKYEALEENHEKLQKEMDVILEEAKGKEFLFEQKVRKIAGYREQIKEGEMLRCELKERYEEKARELQNELEVCKQRCAEFEVLELAKDIERDNAMKLEEKTKALESMEQTLEMKKLETESMGKEIDELQTNQMVLKDKVLELVVKESMLEDREQELESVKAEYSELKLCEQALEDEIIEMKLNNNISDVLIEQLESVKRENADLRTSKAKLEEKILELEIVTIKETANDNGNLIESLQKVDSKLDVTCPEESDCDERKDVGNEKEAVCSSEVLSERQKSVSNGAIGQQSRTMKGHADENVISQWDAKTFEIEDSQLDATKKGDLALEKKELDLNEYPSDDYSECDDYDRIPEERDSEDETTEPIGSVVEQGTKQSADDDDDGEQATFADDKQGEPVASETRSSSTLVSMARGIDDPLSAESLLKHCLSVNRVVYDKEAVKRELCIEQFPSITLEEGEVVGYPKGRCKQSRAKPEHYVDFVLSPAELTVKYDPGFEHYEPLPPFTETKKPNNKN
eukprot:gene6882-12488_t